MIKSSQMTRQHDINVDEAINRYISRIKDIYGNSICQVVLFGSYARGEAGPGSDVDLMVITTDASWGTEYRLITMGYNLYPEMGVLLSVKVRTPGEYSQSGRISFLRNVKKDGILVG